MIKQQKQMSILLKQEFADTRHEVSLEHHKQMTQTTKQSTKESNTLVHFVTPFPFEEVSELGWGEGSDEPAWLLAPISKEEKDLGTNSAGKLDQWRLTFF